MASRSTPLTPFLRLFLPPVKTASRYRSPIPVTIPKSRQPFHRYRQQTGNGWQVCGYGILPPVSAPSPYTGCFAALGHGVCDADTGVLLPLQWGSVCGATVLGVTRGVTGTPGELQGAFLDSAFTLSSLLGKDGMISSGTVLGNYSCGLIVRADSSSILSASGIQTEVHTGEAKILSTIGGTQPQLFDAQIEKVSFSDDDTSRNIVIQITDPDLIAATGGIVQGMSGSPIIQNGKLVGAVTHVFVSDPEKGYGIFAETMLDALDNTVEESKAG